MHPDYSTSHSSQAHPPILMNPPHGNEEIKNNEENKRNIKSNSCSPYTHKTMVQFLEASSLKKTILNKQ